MTEDNLPPNWSPERNRSEFLRWLDVLFRLAESSPPTWAFWHEAREVQETLAVLAHRLGFGWGPIERRTETTMDICDEGAKEETRHFVIATDPSSPLIAEMFTGWISYLDAKPRHSHGVRGGMPDADFRERLLSGLGRWRSAVGSGA